MNDEPATEEIVTVEKFLSQNEIDLLMELHKITKLTRAGVVINNKTVYLDDHRKCTQGRITGGSLIRERQQVLMKDFGSKYLDFKREDLNSESSYIAGRYEVGEFFNWHPDWGEDDDNRTRRVTSVLQITDPSEYEGGNLEFINGVQASKIPGTLFIFDSKFHHRVTHITKGVRRSCMLFAHWTGDVS